MRPSVAFQMDPMEKINPRSDSSYLLAMEAQRRGYAVFHYLPQDMTLENGVLKAWVRPLKLRKPDGSGFYSLGTGKWRNLASFDLILMRQDPPFDMAYITATHLLEHVMDKVPVLNNPVSVRNAPEKLLITHFPDLMPPTLISANAEALTGFYHAHKDIIFKPLYGNAGADVFHVPPHAGNLTAILEILLRTHGEPIIAQKYLPAIRTAGDKRIILVDGEPTGAFVRIPAPRETRANLRHGAKRVTARLTKRDREICARLGPTLKKLGLVFAGLDVIGDYVTEINVTSPTGLHQINALSKLKLESQIWDAFEARIQSFKVSRGKKPGQNKIKA